MTAEQQVMGIDRVINFFPSLRLEENPFLVLDVFIVIIFAWLVYRFLQQKRAVRILWGLVVLVIILMLGQILELRLVNMLMRWVVTSLVVAIPVVFQPELRSALERVGRTTRYVTDIGELKNLPKRLPRSLPKSDLKAIVTEVSRSVLALSTSKTGALIVLAKHTGLRDIIESGEIINANLTTRLLVSLFQQSSPTHDGAAVIVGNKIVAISVILPLTEEEKFLTSGTRHRAAVGLTEQSDALVLVISEQTGDVSIADAGKLTKVENISNLNEIILKKMAG